MESHSQGGAIDDNDSIGFHGKLVQFIFERIGLVLFLDDEKFLCGRLEPRRYANANCSFHFITSDHPHVDSCISYLGDALLDVLLQFVLDSSYSQQLHVDLQRLDCLSDCLFSVHHRCIRIVVLFTPGLVLSLGQQLLGED